MQFNSIYTSLESIFPVKRLNRDGGNEEEDKQRAEKEGREYLASNGQVFPSLSRRLIPFFLFSLSLSLSLSRSVDWHRFASDRIYATIGPTVSVSDKTREKKIGGTSGSRRRA